MKWYQRQGLLNVIIGAVAAWFIKTRKGPDTQQQELIDKSKERAS